MNDTIDPLGAGAHRKVYRSVVGFIPSEGHLSAWRALLSCNHTFGTQTVADMFALIDAQQERIEALEKGAPQ